MLVGILALAYAWVLLTPVLPSVARAGMLRFNLLSDSFGVWALQQPVPSMYNFSNEACFGPAFLAPRLNYVQMNHYPPRFFTFSIRDAHQDALPMIMKSRSSFQGETVEVHHLIEEAPNGMKMAAILNEDGE